MLNKIGQSVRVTERPIYCVEKVRRPARRQQFAAGVADRGDNTHDNIKQARLRTATIEQTLGVLPVTNLD